MSPEGCLRRCKPTGRRDGPLTQRRDKNGEWVHIANPDQYATRPRWAEDWSWMNTAIRRCLKVLTPVRYQQRLRRWLRPKGEVQWCRVIMNREIEQFIRTLDCSRVDALEISGTGSKGRYN